MEMIQLCIWQDWYTHIVGQTEIPEGCYDRSTLPPVRACQLLLTPQLIKSGFLWGIPDVHWTN